MYRFDIFCDASVGSDLRGACAGALIETVRYDDITGKKIEENPQKEFIALIQPNGTNNSGEVAAVAMAVNYADKLQKKYRLLGENIVIHIFSDSLITIKGVREWLPNWIRSSKDNMFLNSTGAEVKNQQYFKYIFNTFLLNPELRIRFFHQDGHVINHFNSIIPNFRKRNGIYLSDLGLSPAHICINNDIVDNETRRIITSYLMRGDTCGYPIEGLYQNASFLTSYKVLDDSEAAVDKYIRAIS